MAAAWLEEEGCRDAMEDGLPAGEGLVAKFAPADEGGLEDVVAEA